MPSMDGLCLSESILSILVAKKATMFSRSWATGSLVRCNGHLARSGPKLGISDTEHALELAARPGPWSFLGLGLGGGRAAGW